ncbi:hypothetical protein [Frankia sp. Cas3]|nr:hypothetical protein [Frankia sp. Cas3]
MRIVRQLVTAATGAVALAIAAVSSATGKTYGEWSAAWWKYAVPPIPCH